MLLRMTPATHRQRGAGRASSGGGGGGGPGSRRQRVQAVGLRAGDRLWRRGLERGVNVGVAAASRHPVTRRRVQDTGSWTQARAGAGAGRPGGQHAGRRRALLLHRRTERGGRSFIVMQHAALGKRCRFALRRREQRVAPKGRLARLRLHNRFGSRRGKRGLTFRIAVFLM
jgi:hypothetical protein